MPSALIGYSGFVGSNLARQRAFDDLYNSSNIEEIRGRHYDLLVCAALPAAKWIANREPERDLANTRHLIACLTGASAGTLVLISTVDVYPNPVAVDEDSPIDPGAQQPYGRHRLLLEQGVAESFGRALVARLPGLFGPGLKKNALYDLLHDHETHKIHSEAVYQFYDLSALWRDLERALDAGLSRVNLATPPLEMGEVAREAFGLEFRNRPHDSPARYDFRTRHDRVFGGRGGYICDRAQILRRLGEFVAREREGPQ